MPEQTSSTLKITLPILGVVVLGALVFFFLNLSSDSVVETQTEQPAVVTEKSELDTALENGVLPPNTTTEDGPAIFKAIQDKVDAGLITPEDAKKIAPPTLPPSIDN